MNQHPSELLVSFWKIALDNFPEGDFRHRKLETDEAVALVNGVKEKGKVYFGTEADIGAPYNDRALRKAMEFVDVLAQHFHVSIHIDEFFSDFEHGNRHALPISLFDIRPDRPLLVTTCHYVWERKPTKDDLGMSIAPDSVKFHLFELRSGKK